MNATEKFKPNQPVQFKVDGVMVKGKFLSDYNGSALVLYNGKKYGRVYEKVFQVDGAESSAINSKPLFHFNVNQRFDFIDRLVDMVVKKHAKGLVITGSGGLGKTHTVMEGLKKKGLIADEHYHKVSGHMTPKGLYRKLYEACQENEDALLIFDDCDSVLKNELSANLLKAALDSYGDRRINWFSEMGMSSDGGEDGELPKFFSFTGSVIFISNYALSDFPQPIISRSLYVDVTMTQAEKIERIRSIGQALCPDLSPEEVEECVNLLGRLKDHIADLNFRTMMKVGQIRKAQPNNWNDLATYVCCSNHNG
jgi:hypothetical protein